MVQEYKCANVLYGYARGLVSVEVLCCAQDDRFCGEIVSRVHLPLCVTGGLERKSAFHPRCKSNMWDTRQSCFINRFSKCNSHLGDCRVGQRALTGERPCQNIGIPPGASAPTHRYPEIQIGTRLGCMPKKSAEQCNWAGCDRAARSRVVERDLCLEHFLDYSQRRLETIQRSLAGSDEERHLPPEVQSFLSEVISQTTILAMETRLLAAHQRDNLIKLSTTAAEIYKRIQRTPRLVRRVCCLVSTGTVPTEIPEKCYTVNVSKHGACIELRQSLKQGQTITVEKANSRKCARGKVAWIKQTMLKRYLVGIEILDDEDFWGMGPAGKKCGASAVGEER